MDFAFAFLERLWPNLLDGLPIFGALGIIISTLSAIVGYKERWSFSESQYFGFITALTVGYGDIRPVTGLGRFLSILIALVGMITTGIMIAIAVETANKAYEQVQLASCQVDYWRGRA